MDINTGMIDKPKGFENPTSQGMKISERKTFLAIEIIT